MTFVCLMLALLRSSVVEVDARHVAIDWATSHREEAYDAVLPAASVGGIGMPVCRVTTLRSSGSVDTFEYMVRIVELCDSISHEGRVVKAEPTGEFIIAESSPLTDQLATIRLAEPSITFEEAVPRLQIKRHPLSREVTRSFLREVRSLSCSVQPPLQIAFGEPLYELASATRMAVRLFEINAQVTATDRRITAAAHRIASGLGYGEAQLRHDASKWN